MNPELNYQKSSMTVKKYLDPPYDLFGKGQQTSASNHSNTSVKLDPTGFENLFLDFDSAHRIQVTID
jgi:hypothetical protein